MSEHDDHYRTPGLDVYGAGCALVVLGIAVVGALVVALVVLIDRMRN